MIGPYCIHCFKQQDLNSSLLNSQVIATTDHHALCYPCHQTLSQLYIPRSSDQDSKDVLIYSLYQYDNWFRTLVLRAKVQSDHQALLFLTELFCQDQKTKVFCDGIDAVMAAPSSFWGRARGRLDLAHALAIQLAVQQNIRLINAPLQLYWRWRKRARMQHRESKMTQTTPHNSAVISDQNISRQKPYQILLVDDVTTTGHTLNETIAKIKDTMGRHQTVIVRCLTLASAGHSRRS